ncbi:MAG TPA: hypothetical protein VFV52_14755 [Bacilli bacterium]|nr:hypothetical protein [Bacilli bacterium]
MKKAFVLFLLTCIPVYFALFGYSGPADANSPANFEMVKDLLVNPISIGLLGGIVALILQTKRSMWWAMIVCFFYAYLGLGLVWGSFVEYGWTHRETLNLAAMLSVFGFVSALLLYFLTRLLKRARGLEDRS